MTIIRRAAIKIDQPLGTFVAFSLEADKLLPLTYAQQATLTQQMESEDAESGGYSFFGNQRREKPRRLDEISGFIQSNDATFPNAIILAANYDEEGNFVADAQKWRVEETEQGFTLVIPENPCRASIIDGQHRLHAFQRLPKDAKNRNMPLLCVVFLELPTPFHAFVFATINFNQVKVDRSLAYQLFGFQVDQQDPSEWVPETAAVALARILSTAKESPFAGHITSGLADDEKIVANKSEMKISLATVVDGILSLITKKPKKDREQMRASSSSDCTRAVLAAPQERPLRKLFIEGNDRAIYDVVKNYFAAVEIHVWEKSAPNSYFRKTVGIQAQFDVLLELLNRHPPTKESASFEQFSAVLKRCEGIAERGSAYQASGIGRSDIRRDMLGAIDSAT